MKNMKHLLAGFAIGVVFAVVPSCGTMGKCSPSNCATGCCDAQGQCQLGNSNGACGQLGGTCAVCQIAQACNLGTCMQGNPNGGGTGQGGGSGGGSGGGTNGGGTGGGTTGGGTGGSMGGGSGGDGGTCDGCIYNGSCLNLANSTSNSACGRNGVQCATCTGTQNCVNFVCTGGTGGGTGGGGTGGGGTGGGGTGGGTGGGGTPTGGGTGGGTPTGGGTGGGTGGQPIGGACTTTANCASGLTCKTTTQRGDTTYPQGYCTKGCAMDGDCGLGNLCVGGAQSSLQFYGENSAFCVGGCPSAGSQSTCRSGYTCEFANNGTAGACWLSTLPPFSAGGQATNSGQPCTVDTCQPSNVNSLLTFCFKNNLPDGGFSGWTNGTCSADCSYDNTGTFCGPNATCVTLGQAPNQSEVCLGTCPTAGTRSTCRNPGYSCFGLRGADGGASGTNICYPDCTITGCQTGTCNTTSGQCM